MKRHAEPPLVIHCRHCRMVIEPNWVLDWWVHVDTDSDVCDPEQVALAEAMRAWAQ